MRTSEPQDPSMPQRGRITNWKDDKGFGFIVPAAGGRQAFVHISSFSKRNRRPVENDRVTYRLTTDPQGRLQAVDVELVERRVQPLRQNGPLRRAIAVAGSFFAALLVAVAIGVYPIHLFGLYCGASGVAFVMYWLDKRAARNSMQRTAENTLHAAGVLGGWPGALVAMHAFRHKSSKTSFQWMFWLTVLINCGVLVWLASAAGASALASLLEALEWNLPAGLRDLVAALSSGAP